MWVFRRGIKKRLSDLKGMIVDLYKYISCLSEDEEVYIGLDMYKIDFEIMQICIISRRGFECESKILSDVFKEFAECCEDDYVFEEMYTFCTMICESAVSTKFSTKQLASTATARLGLVVQYLERNVL